MGRIQYKDFDMISFGLQADILDAFQSIIRDEEIGDHLRDYILTKVKERYKFG